MPARSAQQGRRSGYGRDLRHHWLAYGGLARDTFAMTEEEIRERVKEILLKQADGEDLTLQEETILAYAYYAAGEQSVRIWVRPDLEAAE